MRTGLTLAITKVAASASRVAGRGQGAALPGLVAERLDPELARTLASKLPHGSIIITGTNGKTTTTKLLRAALEANGEVVLSNRSGSNLKRGVVSALIHATSIRGKTKATIGLFEVDEASVRLVAPLVLPRVVIVLNLFRDQLDRYGELDTTAALIGEGIASIPNTQVILNADDPLVASLARFASAHSTVTYFGIDGLPAELATGDRGAVDSDRSPISGEKLHFSRIFYAHLGHYESESFSRPRPHINLTSVEHADVSGSDFEVSVNGKRHKAHLALPGVYNLYNALAALAGTETIGIGTTQALDTFSTTTAAFGRVEAITWRGRKLLILLIKNPTGATQILETFLVREKAPHVLIAINDNYADGRDVSWLWDIPFERLATTEPNVTVCGTRAADMALRLKYAAIQAEREDVLNLALAAFVKDIPEGATGYILPTYTAMVALRKIIAQSTNIPEAGE
jgi:UDP-N-acetylmuramyl tripeptide synthase